MSDCSDNNAKATAAALDNGDRDGALEKMRQCLGPLDYNQSNPAFIEKVVKAQKKDAPLQLEPEYALEGYMRSFHIRRR